MTASLTTLISRVQAMLLDSGTNYTTATCTAAIRQALKEFNDVAPRFAAELIEVVADQHEYELAFTEEVYNVIGVWLNDSDGDDDEPLDFTDFTEDNRVYIRLEDPQTEGEDLLVRYSTPNTINGLDSAVESTIPAIFDQVLVDGGAYYAICIRSVGRVEPINLNKDVPRNLRDTAQRYMAAFEAGKRRAAERKPKTPKADPTWDYEPTGY